jgi:hypothetical protein
MPSSTAQSASRGTNSLNSSAFAVPTEGGAAIANVNALIARDVATIAAAADAGNQPYDYGKGGRDGGRGRGRGGSGGRGGGRGGEGRGYGY